MTNANDDQPPTDLDTFRKTLSRRVADFSEYWRGCKSPRCRRMKRCVDKRLLCAPEASATPMTEAEAAEVRASLRQALADEMQRRGIVR